MTILENYENSQNFSNSWNSWRLEIIKCFWNSIKLLIFLKKYYLLNKIPSSDPEQQQTLTANVLEHINPDLIQQIAAQEAQKEAIKFAKEQVQAAQGGSARPNISQISSPLKSPNMEPRGIFGPIIGCCGRAPHVHFFRQGQR